MSNSTFINVRSFGVGTAKVWTGTFLRQTGTTVHEQIGLIGDPDRRLVAGKQITFTLAARSRRRSGRNLLTIWNQANTTQKVEILDVDVGIYSAAAITGIPIPVAGQKILTDGNLGSSKQGTYFAVQPTDTALGSLHGNIRIRANPGGSYPMRTSAVGFQQMGMGSPYHFAVVNPEESAGWPMQKLYTAYPFLEAPLTLRGSQGYAVRQGTIGAAGTWIVNIRFRMKPL